MAALKNPNNDIIKKARDRFRDTYDLDMLLDKLCKEHQLCNCCRAAKLKNNKEFCGKCQQIIKEISKEYIDDGEE